MTAAHAMACFCCAVRRGVLSRELAFPQGAEGGLRDVLQQAGRRLHHRGAHGQLLQQPAEERACSRHPLLTLHGTGATWLAGMLAPGLTSIGVILCLGSAKLANGAAWLSGGPDYAS